MEQAVETLDETEDFDLELIGATNGARDGGVQGGGIAPGSEDADALHDFWLWLWPWDLPDFGVLKAKKVWKMPAPT